MAENSLSIGIDLGTKNLLVYVEGQGIIFNQPSVVAFDVQTGNVIAGGKDAFDMVGKTHGKIKVSFPLVNGVISDMDAAKALIKFVFSQVETIKSFKNSYCVICCPSEVTAIEKDALAQLVKELGIASVLIEEEIKAGALGSGIDIYSPTGSMILDIGGGTTDVGVLSLGDVVLSESIRQAGNYIDEQIVRYVQHNYSLIIGSKTAEKAKIEIATLINSSNDDVIEIDIKGRELVSGLPKSVKMTSDEVIHLMLPVFDNITRLIKNVLEKTPPELAADIVDTGIVVNGGGALIPGVKEYLEEQLHIPVKIAENPLTAVIEGTKILLKNKGSYMQEGR